jgi:hypothetical protein
MHFFVPGPPPAPLQVIYMEIEPWPNNVGLKMRCYWDVLANTLRTWETFWEPGES